MKPLFISLSLLIFLSGCNSSSKTQEASTTQEKPAEKEEASEADHENLIELTTDQLKIGDIGLGRVEYRSLGQLLQVNGRLAVPAQSQIAVTGLQGGFVRSLPLLPGQPIRKGQVLARIENPDLLTIQQDYAENTSRLTYLDAEFVRQKELSEQNVSALKVFQQTTADRNQLRARVNGLAQRLRMFGLSPETALTGKFTSFYVVTAPVSGVVTNVSATVGQYVQPADIIAQVTSNTGLYAELTVFEKDLPFMQAGQNVILRFNNGNSKEYKARIDYINQAFDTDRSVRVVAKLLQTDPKLIPNTFLKATVDLGDSRVTALPEGAIVSSEGKDYIFIVTDEKMPEEHEHSENEKEHKPEEEHDHKAGETEQHGTTFRRIAVRRGVTESGYSQVYLPSQVNLEKAQVVVKGAYAVLSQLNAASGEEEGHAH